MFAIKYQTPKTRLGMLRGDGKSQLFYLVWGRLLLETYMPEHEAGQKRVLAFMKIFYLPQTLWQEQIKS